MNLRQAFLDLAEHDLTSAQFRVVSELGRGPVKVVAGAGSGKTTTMAYLYAAAVAGGMPVSRIMAVTFTDRAAVELKEKILTALAAARLLPEPAVGDPLEGAWVGTPSTSWSVECWQSTPTWPECPAIWSSSMRWSQEW